MAKINKKDMTPEQLAELEARNRAAQEENDQSDAKPDSQTDAGGEIADSEPDKQVSKTDQPDEDTKPKTTGRKTKSVQTDTDDTGGKDALGKSKPAACEHEYVFHMSQIYQDRPGKKFVYKRCAKCNHLKLFIEDIKK